MLLDARVLLSLFVCVAGQQTLHCPTQDEILKCSSAYVKKLSERTTTPIHNIFSSQTLFITPLQWNEWEVDQICRPDVKENYKLYLMCAVKLRERCVLEDRRDPFMTKWRIDRAINFLCDFYKCNDCTRRVCERCERDRFFDFSCASMEIPKLSSCMQPYEDKIYVPSSSDLDRRRWEFNEYQCRLINHHRWCTMDAYRSCSPYTVNLTNWFTDYNRPFVCAATSHTISAILLLTTAALTGLL